ncbi:Choline transport protein [Cercospora beticola]|uniref:Choline transport protein n=1 Tax=Cercospora beticola TaxID=122368 RepID=A0A2G5I417_CERBT|nr:Choline transport protein [Cercospora beticola]PIA99233.1 Choline transport protein [Cercospora beticola]
MMRIWTIMDTSSRRKRMIGASRGMTRRTCPVWARSKSCGGISEACRQLPLWSSCRVHGRCCLQPHTRACIAEGWQGCSGPMFGPFAASRLWLSVWLRWLPWHRRRADRVSEFAPAKYQKLLSYFTGWMSTLSWQAGTASGPFLVGTMIQSVAAINNPSYAGTNWQGTLCVWAITILVLFANVYGGNAMPVFQNLMLILHVFGFLTIIVCIWVLAPRNAASVVFTEFYNGGDWQTMGLALMVGQISAIYACICSDAAAHMSEEIKDASVTVPRAMIGSYVLNGGLGIIFLVTFLFSVVDLEGALEADYPFLYVFQNAFSIQAVNALSSIVIILIFAGTLSYNLSTSRQTWSFARDNGLPFSGWISKVNTKLEVPANAVIVTCAFTIVLSFINFGSDVAFNAIISLNLVSLMITYQVSIACVLYRRVYQPELLPKARWSLGKYGVAINIGGLAYSSFAFFWCFWPNIRNPSLVDFNWSVLMFVVVGLIAAIDWVVRARHVYTGPVVLVEGFRDY